VGEDVEVAVEVFEKEVPWSPVAAGAKDAEEIEHFWGPVEDDVEGIEVFCREGNTAVIDGEVFDDFIKAEAVAIFEGVVVVLGFEDKVHGGNERKDVVVEDELVDKIEGWGCRAELVDLLEDGLFHGIGVWWEKVHWVENGMEGANRGSGKGAMFGCCGWESTMDRMWWV
jgi:hypothetical protein